jgi:hypothetical protein
VTQPEKNLDELAAIIEDDPYMIVCPVGGYDEFEDIYVAGENMLRWARLSEINLLS